MIREERKLDSRKIEDLERQLTQIKAKEYDKVDFIKKNAELEGRLQVLIAEKETMNKDKKTL